MAATTVERLAVIEEQLKQNVSEHKDIKTVLGGMDEKLSKFIESADTKYASKKRVETIESQVTNMRLTMAKWTGIAVVIMAIIQFLMSKIEFQDKDNELHRYWND